MILAVVPACGRSTRMGRPKLALPLGESTVLQRCVGALREGGADHVLVVVGPHVPELVSLAESAGASVLKLDSETADMRATVEAGLEWLEERFHPAPDDGWLLSPGDHPALEPAIIAKLISGRASSSEASIFIPVYDGRRGHPALIGWNHVAGMRAIPAGQGLNVYLRTHAEQTREVAVESRGILLDLDTPEDYERWRRDSRPHAPREEDASRGA